MASMLPGARSLPQLGDELGLVLVQLVLSDIIAVLAVACTCSQLRPGRAASAHDVAYIGQVADRWLLRFLVTQQSLDDCLLQPGKPNPRWLSPYRHLL